MDGHKPDAKGHAALCELPVQHTRSRASPTLLIQSSPVVLSGDCAVCMVPASTLLHI